MPIMCRTAGGVSLDRIGKVLDLSSQINGVTDTFVIGERYTGLVVYYNGIQTTTHVAEQHALSFRLDFVPTAGSNRELVVTYNML